MIVHRSRRPIAFALVIFSAVCTAVLAQDPPPPSLQELLKTTYKVTVAGTDSYGFKVIDPGTIFTLEKPGVIASSQTIPGTNVRRLFSPCSNTFKNGELSKSGMCPSTLQGVRYLDKGWKVFMTKMDINSKKHKITLTLVECDSCNGLNTLSSYTAKIDFEFADKFLDTAEPGQITDVIGQVLKPDATSTKSFTGNSALPAPAAQPSDGVSAAAPIADSGPIAPPATSTQQVQIGDTEQQVIAILGKPPVRLNGANGKIIYKYPSLKVTFSGGKVTDFE